MKNSTTGLVRTARGGGHFIMISSSRRNVFPFSRQVASAWEIRDDRHWSTFKKSRKQSARFKTWELHFSYSAASVRVGFGITFQVSLANSMKYTEMRMLRWMMGMKTIEKIRNEETRSRSGVANISEKIWGARLRWLGHVERKTEEDVVLKWEHGRWKWVDAER